MDFTKHSIIRGRVRPVDLGIHYTLPELEDEIDDSQFDDDSVILSSHCDNPVRLVIQRPLAPKSLPYNFFRIIPDDEKDPSIDGPDVTSFSENVDFRKEESYQFSVSSATGSLSNQISETGDEIFESLNPKYIKSRRYDPEPYGVREPKANELDKLSIGTSDFQDTWSSENESNVSDNETNAPVIVPWNEDAVDISDIPSHCNKPATSDITDLGDRGFRANEYLAHRRSLDLLRFEQNYEHLALRERFSEVRVRCGKGKGFFPRALLSGLITEKCVYEQLSHAKCLGNEHTADQIRAYAKTICEESLVYSFKGDSKPPRTKSFKKIFTILVMIEETSSILKFLQEDINDINLPLENHPWGRNSSLYDLRRGGTNTEKLECFKSWTQFKIEAFYEWQWATISPFFHKGFRKDVKHFLLHDSVILPFMPDGSQEDEIRSRAGIKGGFGRVFRVTIHPEHHNFTLSKNQPFAIKRLNSSKEEDFRKEVEILKMFSDDAHPHLISLLATYEYRRAYYLIFPWADGDLDDLWVVHNPEPYFDTKTFRWVAKQCEGIASGLVKIHNYQTSNSKCHPGFRETRYGRHGDLTPQNILWFDDADGGMLKITDFGLSEFSTTHSKTYRPRSGVATTMSYRPPESDIVGGKIGQSSDIWTLGCLYLEFITWLLGGIKLVNEFTMKRRQFDRMWHMDSATFFEIVELYNSKGLVGRKATAKKAVKDFIMRDLHGHPNCTEFLHDFINLIEFDMLVVKSDDPEDTGRITSQQLHARLAAILVKCEDPDYLSKPACWNARPQACSWNSQTCEVVTEDYTTESTRKSLHQKRFPLLEGSVKKPPQPKLLAVPATRRLSIHN